MAVTNIFNGLQQTTPNVFLQISPTQAVIYHRKCMQYILNAILDQFEVACPESVKPGSRIRARFIM